MSLKEVMEQVSKNLDAPVVSAHAIEPMSELEAFAKSDDLLAALRKEYLDVKAIRLKTQKEFGRDDSMVDMAVDVEDSAWCAMQTRYMELRDNQIAAIKAKNVIEEERRIQKIAREKLEQQKALDYYYSLQKIAHIKETAKFDYALFIWAMIMLDSIRAEFFRIQNSYKFNVAVA